MPNVVKNILAKTIARLTKWKSWYHPFKGRPENLGFLDPREAGFMRYSKFDQSSLLHNQKNQR